MKKIQIIILAVVALFLPLQNYAQVSTVISNTTKQIVKIITKRSGTELSKFGGETAVKQAVVKIAKESGEEGIKLTEKYVATHGIRALSAIESSPKIVLSALEKCPTQLKERLITISKKNSELVKKLGSEGLILESKFAGLGEKIAPLSDDITRVAHSNLSKLEVKNLASNVIPLEAVKKQHPSAFNKFVDDIKKAPANTVKLLNDNPKVLFTGAALMTFVNAKNDLIGPNGHLVKPLKATGWIAVAVSTICGFLFCVWVFQKLNLWNIIKKTKQTNN